jgi:uncharacterized protein
MRARKRGGRPIRFSDNLFSVPSFSLRIQMEAAITDLKELLRSLRPGRVAGVFAFCRLPEGSPVPASAVGWFREAEGVSVILPVAEAEAAGWRVDFEAAWITLNVRSALAAVGLTAAVSTALAAEGISANIVAAYHHDHLFVPLARAADALRVLERLQGR